MIMHIFGEGGMPLTNPHERPLAYRNKKKAVGCREANRFFNSIIS